MPSAARTCGFILTVCLAVSPLPAQDTLPFSYTVETFQHEFDRLGHGHE